MNIIERVHIVPLGFEEDRVILPLIEKKCDKVYLIRKKIEKPEIEIILKSILSKLKKNKIPCFIKKFNFNAMEECIPKLKEIINKEKNNEIYINISTSTKLSSIYFYMVSSLYNNSKCYYVEPQKYLENKKDKIISEGVEKIIEIPEFSITNFRKDELIFLKIINEKKEIRKNELIKEMKKKEIFEMEKKEGHNTYNLLRNRYSEKFKELKFIEEFGLSKKSQKFKLTDQGKKMLILHS
jgi:hypothetical protein